MSKEPSKLRFDHREVAVVFSLFVFVSLLMFTVGILVGKGLAQARYETMLARDSDKLRPSTHAASEPNNEADTSSEGEEHEGEAAHSAVEANAKDSAASQNHSPDAKKGEESGAHKENKNAKQDAEASETAVAKADAPQTAKASEPLKLIPKKQENPDLREGLKDSGQMTAEAAHVLKNPKLKGIFEGEEGRSRGTASAPVNIESKANPTKVAAKVAAKEVSKTPATTGSAKSEASNLGADSLAQGKFTVQVGSYTAEKDAAERVEALKALGFTHAYFSAKELGEKRETYYRVWLGYFADPQKAEQSGQMLKDKGEVKNFIVRKTDGGT